MEPKKFVPHIAKHVPDILDADKTISDRAFSKIFMNLIGFIFLSGAESLKVTWRENFGKNGVNIVYLSISSTLMLGVAYLEILVAQYGGYPDYIGASFIASFAIGTFVLGYNKKKKAKDDSYYTGDTWAEMNNKVSRRSSVIYIDEPLICSFMGIIYGAVFYIWGSFNFFVWLPFGFCAFSVYPAWVLEQIFKPSSDSHKNDVIEKTNSEFDPTSRPNEVISD